MFPDFAEEDIDSIFNDEEVGEGTTSTHFSCCSIAALSP
jgi:hypothetical protein